MMYAKRRRELARSTNALHVKSIAPTRSKTQRSKCKVEWLNWRDYIEILYEQPKTSDVVCAVVSLDSADQTIALVTKLNVPDLNCDFLILDNKSQSEEARKLQRFSSTNQISLIRTSHNLGSAGGYSMAVEWCKEKAYNFLALTEDDVVPHSSNALKEMIERKAPSKVVAWTFHENNSAAFSFHGRLYPIGLLKLAGGPDVDLFMRADDEEWAHRLFLGQKQLGIEEVTLTHIKYTHPLLKRQRRVWPIYFVVRNSLLLESRRGSFGRWTLALVKRIPLSLILTITNRDPSALKATFLAIIDFAFGNEGIPQNTKRLTQLHGLLYKIPRGSCETTEQRSEILAQGRCICIEAVVSKAISLPQSKWAGLIRRDVTLIASSYFSPLLPIFLVKKNVIFLEEATLPDQFRLMKVKQNRVVSIATIVGSMALGLVIAIAAFIIALPRFVREKKSGIN
jgi:hypothetical protein